MTGEPDERIRGSDRRCGHRNRLSCRTLGSRAARSAGSQSARSPYALPMRWSTRTLLALLTACATAPPQPAPTYDIVIRNGMIYDGTGADPIRGDVAIRGDRIV